MIKNLLLQSLNNLKNQNFSNILTLVPTRKSCFEILHHYRQICFDHRLVASLLYTPLAKLQPLYYLPSTNAFIFEIFLLPFMTRKGRARA